jgi:hypothetical protein
MSEHKTLRCVDSDSNSKITQDEAALLTAFRTMSSEYRASMLSAMRSIACRFERKPPALTLVQPAQAPRVEAV